MQRHKIPQAYLYRQVVHAKLYIEANYASHIDLEIISQEACFSKFHFLRLFKESFGLTPNQFLVDVRLRKAKELLRQGHSVQDTCWRVGYESMSSFSLLFKKRIGVSPIRFMQACKSQRERLRANPLVFIPGCFAASFSSEE